MKQKVLIIKIGFIETVGNEQFTGSISLGDILRTTVVLHLYKDCHVTWLTAEEGIPLLAGNPYIDRILAYNLTSVLQLQSEQFDIVINLEKVPGICAFTDKVSAWKRYGFRFDVQKGDAAAYEHAYEALANSADPHLRRETKKSWFEMLYSMVGSKWKDESYLLGYKPKTKEIYDVGFNYKVGGKWPNKAWPMEHWKELEGIIRKKYSYAYQQSLNDIYGYIDWINSCRILVTGDSLGLHLAIALNKNIVSLFGPSSTQELKFFGPHVAITPPVKYNCIPCFRRSCKKKQNCLSLITPKVVAKSITSLMK